MESYITILQRGTFEYEDRKSVFIGDALPVSEEREAIDFIEAVRKKYPDAKHHVYAYALRDNSVMRFSDDHEPQGTAGMPVLDVIRKKRCTDVAVVVTRYFGGTLLGTGGLVKAYTSSAAGAIENARIITYDIYCELQIAVSYSDYQKILPIFSELGFRCMDTRFTDDVKILGSIKNSNSDAIIDKLVQTTGGKAKINILSEKFDY